MKISGIEILGVEPKEGFIALCMFIIDDAYCVSNVEIFLKEDNSGIRLSYPTKDGFPYFYPAKKAFAKYITRAVQLKVQEVWRF